VFCTVSENCSKECFSEVKAVDLAKNQPQREASVTLASVRTIDAVIQKNLQTHYKLCAVVT
jgi:hypothetical protein